MTEVQTDLDLAAFGPAPSGKLDAQAIAGRKVKIAKVYPIKDTSDYDLEGKYVEGLAREVTKIVFETEPVSDDKVAEPVAIKERINLKTPTAWSTHPKSGMMKLFKKYSINRPEEMIGKEVMLISRPGKEDGVFWPGFETA